jgi:hypothetical protein
MSLKVFKIEGFITLQNIPPSKLHFTMKYYSRSQNFIRNATFKMHFNNRFSI